MVEADIFTLFFSEEIRFIKREKRYMFYCRLTKCILKNIFEIKDDFYYYYNKLYFILIKKITHKSVCT